MAIRNPITNVQVYFYLAYFVSRINRDWIEFETLPFEIAGATEDQIEQAFEKLRNNQLVAAFDVCDDGISFKKTDFLVGAC